MLHRPQPLQAFKTVYPVPVEEETEDAGRVFDFLFRNVQEVSPPSDLNLNDPNLIRQQQQDQQGGVYYKPVEQVSQLLLDKVFLRWAIPGRLLSSLLFVIVQLLDKICPKMGFEPRISGVGSDRSTN